MHSVSRFQSYHSLQTTIHVRQMPYPSSGSSSTLSSSIIVSAPESDFFPRLKCESCIHRIHLSAVQNLCRTDQPCRMSIMSAYAAVIMPGLVSAFHFFLPVEAHLPSARNKAIFPMLFLPLKFCDQTTYLPAACSLILRPGILCNSRLMISVSLI